MLNCPETTRQEVPPSSLGEPRHPRERNHEELLLGSGRVRECLAPYLVKVTHPSAGHRNPKHPQVLVSEWPPCARAQVSSKVSGQCPSSSKAMVFGEIFFWFCFVFAIKKPLRYGTKSGPGVGNLPLEEKILLIRLRYKG